ncbi:uncharacterized protein LOC112088049 [Eutrema salsugineum]|uniref:uncharacterized protein LOC112088049 n=1 Tax=Eutrema salsugineum TaxID=72664 RepID=UPI000CED5982|nr:uncharacterized protein LOC112088049 [Eutrema salsugineum]
MTYRHLAKDDQCSRCQASSETVNHLLFTCPYAQLTWALFPIAASPDGVLDESQYSNLYRVLNIGSSFPAEKSFEELVPWILWRLWKSRNYYIFKGIDRDARDLVIKAKADAEEWRNRTEDEIAVSTTHIPAMCQTKWIPPPPLWVKCNTDGAWPQNGRGGMGWVLRECFYGWEQELYLNYVHPWKLNWKH